MFFKANIKDIVLDFRTYLDPFRFIKDLTDKADLEPHGGRGYEPWGGPGGFADPASNRIVGTDGGEKIYGTERRDVIEAKGGDDTVIASSGDDVVFAGKGNDVIFGHTGNDWLSGGSGNDIIHAGGDGWQNLLNGGPGRELLYGSTYVGVQDIFQFTLASDSGIGSSSDDVFGFRSGEDKIHLAFDSDEFKPGHQSDFYIVYDEEDAGTAGSIWIDGNYGHVGETHYTSNFRLYGHINNDGTPDFEIKFSDHTTDNETEWWDTARQPEEFINISDFIF